MNLNKVIIVGNITRDIELKALPSGIKVANLSVATNRNWKDKDGNKQEAVDYHNIVAFGKQAEVIAQYMSKGSQILVEGRLQTRSWEKDGDKRYATEVMLESFQFGKKTETNNAHKSPEEHAEEKIPFSDDENQEYPNITPEEIPF